MNKRLFSFLILAASASILLFSSCNPQPQTSQSNPSTAMSAGTTDIQDIRFTGNVTFSTVDTNGNGFFEAVVADVEVEILTAGDYLVLGSLEKNGETISSQPTFETMLFSQADVSGVPGIYIVSVAFSGEEIFLSGEIGPYDLCLHAIGEKSHADLTIPTPAYDPTVFGEIGAILTGVSETAVDEDGDGKLDFVEVALDVTVRMSGDYWLQGTLSKYSTSIVHTGNIFFALTPGTHTLNLRFPGLPILRSGLSGPYEGVVSIVNDPGGHNIGGFEFMTRAYRSTRFSGLLELDGRFNDQGIDTNGNGLFDILRIEFGAEISKEGIYLVSGALRNPSEPRFVFTDDVQMTLNRGPQMLTLEFSGALIRDQELDGPYQVEISLRDPATYDELDRVLLGRKTASYRTTDFEPFGWAAIMLTGKFTEQGVDTNSNGLFDELRVEVEVELAEADFYEWSASLMDINGTTIDFDIRRGALDAGLTTIDFVFDGNKIVQNGVNGPYFVKALGMFGQNGSNVVAIQVAQTKSYDLSDFESSDGTTP